MFPYCLLGTRKMKLSLSSKEVELSNVAQKNAKYLTVFSEGMGYFTAKIVRGGGNFRVGMKMDRCCASAP
jgi:hypothetical protein